MQRDLRPVEHAQELGLARVEPGEETIECRIAGAAPEDPVEPRAHCRRPSPLGLALPSLQVAVEPPDQLSDEIDGTTLRLGNRQQLMDQAFGMNPT